MKRTHNCGELRKKDTGQKVTLTGWLHRRRDHGGLIFIDLRDRNGITQVIFNPAIDPEAHEKAHDLRAEYVLTVEGKVNLRPEGTENPDLPTGEIEVIANRMDILNISKPLPFIVEEDTDVAENLRLKYRFLDLRRSAIQQNLMLRHKVTKAAREFLDNLGFIDIETPFLTRSTPEGARDYLVPSRVNPGHFYALPQSPQLFKQLLMVSGFDRYYQIVKCFRDEDLRADRQPEFTQIDLEMSFVDREDVMNLTEELIVSIFRASMVVEIERPFPRLSYHESLNRFGTDKPDIRYGLELSDVSDIVADSGFKVFTDVIKNGGRVKGINAKGLAGLSRKEIDELTEKSKSYGAKGLAWMKVTDKGIESQITKFFSDEILKSITEKFEAENGDILLFVADTPMVVSETLGHLREDMAKRLNLIKEGEYRFVWILDFPLLEYNEEEKRFEPMHHPFTSPMDEDILLLEKEPLNVRAKAYDIV
ncbi:MAG: aspartate--tRNA ligase, partial [Nitrospirota bacterium]